MTLSVKMKFFEWQSRWLKKDRIVDDKGIKDSWKEYMEKLMNEENEWDHKL